MRRSEKLLRVLGVVAVAGFVVFAGSGLWALATGLGGPGGDAVDAGPEHPEFQPDAVVAERVPATDEDPRLPDSVRVDSGAEKQHVVIDVAHTNRIEKKEYGTLVEHLVEAGHEVTLMTSTNGFNRTLEGADAFVVVAPQRGYSRAQAAKVSEFVRNGGRLLYVAEPTMSRLVSGVFGATIERVNFRTTTLGSELGIGFGGRYLYDMEHNDGNYQHVLAYGTDAAPASVERVAAATATRVYADGGTPVLVTADTARLSEGGGRGRYTVALRKGNVLAVGDRSWLTSGRETVADNEAFTVYAVAFLLGADAEELPE